MPTPIACNEPVVPMTSMRSARLWRTLLQPGLPGTLILSKIQLNHGVVDESPIKFEDRVLAAYVAVVNKFIALHGEAAKGFMMRAPEALDLVGLHVEEFGGATLGLACFESVLFVSPRADSKVTIAHIEDRFAPSEFDLAEAPKTRTLDWPAYAAEHRGKAGATSWADAIKGALLYYVNRHKGPTGQVELKIPGLNIVVGSVLPPGYTAPSDTTLAAAALASAMAASGEWGNVPLAEFSAWCAEAQAWGTGRKNTLGAVCFGMAGELVHASANPPKPKTRALPHGHAVLIAHTGLPDSGTPAHASFRATTTQVGWAFLQKEAAARAAAATRGNDVLPNDDQVLEMLRTVPSSISRPAVLESKLGEPFVTNLKKRFAIHPAPESGYPARAKLLFVLAEMQRSARAADALRSGDVTRLAAYMNIGQVGEASNYHKLSASGRIEATLPIHQASSDEELLSMSDHGDPLWRQSGRSGGSTPETDLLADLAMNIPGVLAARWSGSQRVAILCKHEVVKLLTDALNGAYYVGRSLDVTQLVSQVFPCRGVGIVED